MNLSHLPWRAPVRPVSFQKDKEGDRWAAQIDRLALKFEPAVAKAFRAAAAALPDHATIDQLVIAIQQGDADGVATLLGLTYDGSAFAGVLAPLQQAAAAGGGLSLASGGVVGTGAATVATMHFDLLNPHTSSFLRDYGLRLIKQITEEVREGIREALRIGVEGGKNPKVTARFIKEVAGFGMTKQQARAVANYRAELESLDAGALKRQLRDRRFDKTVAAALDPNSKASLSRDQIDKMVAAYTKRTLANRALNIARTESMRAANMGSHLAMRQAVENGTIPEGAIVRRWLVSKDERVCPSCKQVPKLNPNGVGLRDKFVTPLGPALLGPLHVLCRCTVFHRIRPAAIRAAEIVQPAA